MALAPLTYATQPTPQSEQPLGISYTLDQLEDKLEKDFDKQYKVDWDFEIVYHDGKVFLALEYDQKDAKKFTKISSEDLNKMLSDIIGQITKSLKKEVEVSGVIIKDDAQTPTYTFTYKDGKLDIK